MKENDFIGVYMGQLTEAQMNELDKFEELDFCPRCGVIDKKINLADDRLCHRCIQEVQQDMQEYMEEQRGY